MELFRGQGSHAAAEEYRDQFFTRMWDLSEFMMGLKQTFSRWFNKVHERHGTLWEERFKSVLAEDGHATRVIAAYVDLNPVRAGIVADPKDYRWSSYGEAVAGKQRAREGLGRAVREIRERQETRGQETGTLSGWRATAKRYREVLYASLSKGSVQKSDVDGRVSEAEALGDSARQFSEGLVVGLKPFVDRTFQMASDYFGPRRVDGARRMRGIQTELRAMRELR